MEDGMALAVRRVLGSIGERHAILVDESGMPLFYPTLWVTVILRGGALAVNTIQNALNALKCLYAWQEAYTVDIEQRFSSGNLLTANEVHSLRDFLQESLLQKRKRKVVPISQRQKTVGTSTHYARITVAAEYLEFLARRICPSSEEAGNRIAAMVAQIKANRPNQATKTTGRERVEKHLEDSVLDALEVKLKPGAEENPFSGYSVQLRNALIFSILRATGIRRGELLNLQVDDIDFAVDSLRIVRRADSPNDRRRYQPVAKTRERQFPLDAELANSIHDYVVRFRSKVPGANRHGFLFVTHKEGRYQGAPLSNSGFGKIMESLKQIVDSIHAHNLRHHWNYSFSNLSSVQRMPEAKEIKLRSYLMGWEPNSGTAATYNRRHIKKEAAKAMLELQHKVLDKTRQPK
jgi:integrase